MQPSPTTTHTAPSRRVSSTSARERDAAFRRKLDFEVAVMAGQRRAAAEGAARRAAKRAPTLADYPAAFELVRALAARLASRRTFPEVMAYRGRKVRVTVSSFGRVFVSTLNGQPIGVSAFGSMWED